ncbi:TRAP transporter small permease subunit [Devosia sp. XJ19-1]|uniref:TRAP transporter small permease protein n=1 Tax=Devosia ureilytica TaxID=2952754 RepID=A0A9Q4AQX3_9HYPH|nr:TRAP transporter small permease subunit [Devosia ureilytica]MCP8885326.1 TRAP transporter small permease subunit [Devosia ureilytica]MCP8888784.1 TRAP transporter small permease subunit [Devosia ureilytica]
MPGPIKLFVRVVDRINRAVGRVAMLLLFAMAGVQLASTFSRLFFGVPINWALEMTQFMLATYFLLGAAYSLQENAHVRMDLLYSRLDPKRRAVTDAITIGFVIFYLVVLLRGGWSSTEYAVVYGQKNYSAWGPLMWPVKSLMTLGIFLMLLQAISNLFKDIATAMGRPMA